MAYSVKKAGIPFKLKLDTNSDLTGQAANFSAYYIDDATGAKTVISDAFVEDVNTAGLYMVNLTIPTAGEYTVVISNAAIGMDNHPASIVVTASTIDDVKTEVDTLLTNLNVVANDVSGIDGVSINALDTTLSSVTAVINNQILEIQTTGFPTDAIVGLYIKGAAVYGKILSFDATKQILVVEKTANLPDPSTLITFNFSDITGTWIKKDGNNHAYVSTATSSRFVSSNGTVDRWLTDIQATIDGSTGLSALAGYTDDIENMLNGTEFLADGVTNNPFYDATNPGVIKEASVISGLTTLQTALQTTITNVQAAIQADIAGVKTVVDTNAATINDSTNGLVAIKALLDTLNTSITTDGATIASALSDATNGLSAINTNANTRFDTVVANITNVENSVSTSVVSQEFYAFL